MQQRIVKLQNEKSDICVRVSEFWIKRLARFSIDSLRTISAMTLQF